MAQVRIDFQGRGNVEAFSRACVQAMGDGIELALRVARQVGTLGQVLAQQSIRVLVGATLPGAVRIGKKDLDGEPFRQARVLSHLFPPIIGQRFTQQSRHMPEFLREARTGTPCLCPLHPRQDDQAGHPLYQGPDGRTIASPRDQVAFPMAGDGTSGHLAGRSAIGVILGIWPRRSVPRARGWRALRA